MGSRICNNSIWTREEDKAFENTLAIYLDDSNLWEKIAAAVPGRTIEEIKICYELLVADINAIELGLVPFPHYADSFKKSRELVGHIAIDRKGKRYEKVQSESSCKGISLRSDLDRKKATWSEEEHRLFLQGLDKYGRGNWRSISKLCVGCRTPTQVASHAQKYFKHMVVVDKGTRSSNHDVTILDNGKIITQQVQTTQLVVGTSGDSIMDTGLYQSLNNRVGGGYLHGSLIDSQCNMFSHVSSTEDISAGIDLLESLLDSLAATPTPQEPSSQQISKSASVSLCTPMNTNQHMLTYGEVVIEDTIMPTDLEIFNSLFIFQHDVSNSQGPIIGAVIGIAKRQQMLNFEASPFSVHPDFGVYAPPTASQLTLDPLLSDGIRGLFPYPGSSMFEMDSSDFVAFFCDEPNEVAVPTYPVPPSSQN